MARNFLQYPFAPYNGAYTSKAFNTGRGQQKGEMVPIDILWGSYSFNGTPVGNAALPNFAVAVNLNTAGPSSVSGTWTPQSVYIDNEGTNFPVYIYFPDTQFAVSCPADAAGWYEIYTLARQALIIGLGVTSAAVTQGQRTRCFFTDVVMVPSLDQENQTIIPQLLATPNPLRGSSIVNTKYGVPALGDTLTNCAVAAVGGETTLLPAQATGGIYIVTHLNVTASDVVISPGPANLAIQINDNTSGISLPWGWNVVATSTLLQFLTVYNGSGFNVLLDATQNYTLRVTGAAGIVATVSAIVAYTYQPASEA
jgi:hypothetical protein